MRYYNSAQDEGATFASGEVLTLSGIVQYVDQRGVVESANPYFVEPLADVVRWEAHLQ